MHVHVRVPVCECVCVCGQATLYLNCSKVSQNWKPFCCLFCQGLPELSPSFHFTFLSFVSPRPFGEEHKWIRSGNLYYVFPVVSSALYTRRYSEVKHAGNILEWSCVCFAVLLFNDSPLRVIVCSVVCWICFWNAKHSRFAISQVKNSQRSAGPSNPCLSNS